MFVIKYDKVSMIKLVQCIEKHPAIYDTKNHYSKEELDSAWDSVALEVGEKDSLCRDRWHSIKSCYIRHLKYTALNSKRRPYYLAEFMDFMLPFLQDKIRSFVASKSSEISNLPTYLKEALPCSRPETVTSFLQQPSSHDQDLVIKEEIVEVEEVSDSEWLSASTEVYQQPTSSKKTIKRLHPSLESIQNSSKKCKTLKINNANDNDEDVKFFKSLLPDLARMSSHQKLKFKQEALSIIEDILYATEELHISDLDEDDEVDVID